MPGRVVVVGGGIAGLVAALELAADHEVVLVEAGDRLGGKLATGSFRGRPLDLGPDAFITRNPTATELCQRLGLAESLIAPAGSGAAIWSRRRLRPLPAGVALGVPTGLRSLARSGVVSPVGVGRAALDLVLPGPAVGAHPLAEARAGGPDPSVAGVVGRRLGTEVLDALVDPLLGGINASDVATLSFAAAAPQLAERAAGRRSLMRALAPTGAARSPEPGPIFLGLAGGLGDLVETLAKRCAALGVSCETGLSVHEIDGSGREGPGWRLRGDETLSADGVVLAVPAFAAAELLTRHHLELAAACAAIPYASVAMVTLAYREGAVPAVTTRALGSGRPGGSDTRLPGNGLLVGRHHRRLVTAVTFVSTKWPRSANPGEVVVRASVGRYGAAAGPALTDADLEAAVRGELAEILGIEAEPLEARIERWPRSFPQYVCGHLAHVAALHASAGRLGGFALAGAAYDGIGIPACVDSGARAAAHLAEALRR